jgi:hypothetical protein
MVYRTCCILGVIALNNAFHGCGFHLEKNSLVMDASHRPTVTVFILWENPS